MQHRFLRTLLLITLAVSACDARRPRPFITPSVRFNRAVAPMGTPLEVTYTFRTSTGFEGLKKDLIVFVHFLDPSGKIRFVDDHKPPILTNQWQAGQDYSYTRTVFVPENIPAGPYVVELGMYTPSGKGERFVLDATRLSDRSYDVGHFTIREQESSAEGDLYQGWYSLEREPGNPWEHWHWTSGEARTRMKNPKADAFFYLKADTDRSRFSDPQEVVVQLNGKEIDRFQMDSSEPLVRKTEVPASDLGAADTAEVVLKVSNTFAPGGGDPRNLGIRVYCIYLGKAAD